MANDSVCVVLRKAANLDDPAFGRRLSETISDFLNTKEPRKPALVTVASPWNNIGGWVIGADIAEADQVYVIREGQGERVTTSTGSAAALEALVTVLRGHGYTCRKSG